MTPRFMPLTKRSKMPFSRRNLGRNAEALGEVVRGLLVYLLKMTLISIPLPEGLLVIMVIF